MTRTETRELTFELLYSLEIQKMKKVNTVSKLKCF